MWAMHAGGQRHRGPLPLRPQRTPATSNAVQAQREADCGEPLAAACSIHRCGRVDGARERHPVAGFFHNQPSHGAHLGIPDLLGLFVG